MARSKMNAEKSELVIGVNSFDQPAELSEINGWSKLITRLLFMRKGTYPSDPDMGCELQRFEYAFIDDVSSEITNIIQSQVQTYLPDIPLTGISVDSDSSLPGRNVLLISLEFQVDDNQYETAVVAAEESRNLINFEVVF